MFRQEDSWTRTYNLRSNDTKRTPGIYRFRTVQRFPAISGASWDKAWIWCKPADWSKTGEWRYRYNQCAYGSLSDIITYPIDVPPKVQLTKVQLLDAILKELASKGFGDGEQADFWAEMTDLQKAKIIR